MVSLQNKPIRLNRYFLPIGIILLSLPFLVGINHPFKKCQSADYTVLKVYDLPYKVRETSGLIYYNNLIWTFNDSGGEPELFAWSEKDSAIVKRVTLWNAYNFDWEDIAQDSTYIYVGDIGNNFGSRGNLCIYRIAKKHLLKKGNKAVRAEKISYTYPNYKPVSYLSFKRSSFDCEAIVYCNDSIYLFSKDWKTFHSIVYSIPAKPGDYLAHKICAFDSEGLITAADYDGKQLILLGYKDNMSFLWIFKSLTDFNIAGQVGKRIDLVDFRGAQTEGIAIKDSHTIYISNEKCGINQRLWEVRIR
jgi:hypothetical protein